MLSAIYACYSTITAEPRHDKTKKMSVHLANQPWQIAWASAQSDQLCAQWVVKDTGFLHADSEDSDQTGRMPRLIWVFAGSTLTLLVFSCRGSAIDSCVLMEFEIIYCHSRRAWLLWDYLNRDMTKPTKWLCAQRRLRSAWAFAQSDQSLRCPHEGRLCP